MILKEFKPGDEITIAKVLELVNGPKYRGKMIRNWSTKKPFDEDEISKISVRQSLNRNNTVFKVNAVFSFWNQLLYSIIQKRGAIPL